MENVCSPAGPERSIPVTNHDRARRIPILVGVMVALLLLVGQPIGLRAAGKPVALPIVLNTGVSAPPSATPTTAPPTATPTTEPEPNALYILDQTFGYVSNIGTLHLVGEVKNGTENDYRLIRIDATLRDGAGAVVGSGYTYVKLDPLGAGKTSCFDVLVQDPPGDWQTAQFEVSNYFDADYGGANLAFVDVDGSYDSTYGWVKVNGSVRNDHGSRVEFVKVVGTLYGEGNRPIGCQSTYISGTHLDAGQQSTFAMTFSGRDYADTDEYKVQTIGDPN